MRSLSLLAATIVVAVLAVAAPAQAAPLRVTSTQAILDTSGGLITLGGDLTGTLGEGAAVTKATPREGGLDATFTIYTPQGALRGRASVDATDPGQEGVPNSSRYEGRATLRGGTGVFKGARGRAAVTATSEPGSIIILYKLDGRLRLAAL